MYSLSNSCQHAAIAKAGNCQRILKKKKKTSCQQQNCIWLLFITPRYLDKYKSSDICNQFY